MNTKLKATALWLIGVFIYAYFSISTTMEELTLNPSIDLYANELDFQILVFIVIKGIWLLLGLVIILFIVDKYQKGKKR